MIVIALSIGLPMLYVLGGAFTGALIWEVAPESWYDGKMVAAIFGGIFWWAALPTMLFHWLIVGRRKRVDTVAKQVADALAAEHRRRDENIARLEVSELPPLFPRGESQPANGTGRRKWGLRK